MRGALPLRASQLVRDPQSGKVSRHRLPLYHYRDPWGVVPWLTRDARGRLRLHRTQCGIVHLPTGARLLRNPVTSDLAIAFCIRCEGRDLFVQHTEPDACRVVVDALAQLSGQPARCAICSYEAEPPRECPRCGSVDVRARPAPDVVICAGCGLCWESSA